MLLLFMGGVNMRAQSVSEEQMDERFNDKKLPYGWFAEGWEVDSTGVVRTKASSGSGFDLEKLIGNNKKEEPEEPQEDPEEDPQSDPEEDPQSDPEEDPQSDPEEEPQSDPEEEPQSDPEENKGNFDLNDLLSSFMGGSGASGQLNVYYSLDGGDNWIYYDTFVQSGYNYFVAPSSGIYRLRFTSPSASLDNFYGFRIPSGDIVNADKVTLSDGEVFDNDIETLCEEITYTRNFSNTKWQALYVPFEMSYEDWSADFEVARLNDVHQWDDDEDGLIDCTELEIVKMTNIGLGAGYGYNFVPGRGWLLHISALPTFIVYSNTSMTFGDTRVPLHYHFPEVIITGRGAVVRHWKNLFFGMTMVFNYTNIGHKESLGIENIKWNVRTFLGLRLGKI